MDYVFEWETADGKHNLTDFAKSEAIRLLDEIKALGPVSLVIYGPDGLQIEEYYFRRAIQSVFLS